MNILTLGICIFLKVPYLLFKYENKENKKIGKRETIFQYICYAADLCNLYLMIFMTSFSVNWQIYIWFGLSLALLAIYYGLYMQYFMKHNLRIIYGINKINLPTVLIEIAIPVVTGFITLNIPLLVLAFIYGVLHYHLESEVQKRVRFR